ncbi:MAG: TIM barrel protein [Pelagimonas sp.]|jgi:hydroxypyruvate isomerase|nr:TIM barrel protein [Pelagimonas sp.]
MAKIAANITLLFPDLPLLDRIARAAELGFDGVECLFPYDVPAEKFAAALQSADLPLALINTPVPDWDLGARGCAAIPGAQAQFQAEFAQAQHFASLCKAQNIHVMAGNTKADGFDAFVENLSWACARAPDLQLLIEPLNPIDMPGYWLSDFDQAVRVIQAVGAPNLGLQFDLWHAQRITGHPTPKAAWHPHIRHVQFAGLENRTAPQTGETGLIEPLQACLKDAPDLWLSAEYHGAKYDDAKWLPDLRRALGPAIL